MVGVLYIMKNEKQIITVLSGIIIGLVFTFSIFFIFILNNKDTENKDTKNIEKETAIEEVAEDEKTTKENTDIEKIEKKEKESQTTQNNNQSTNNNEQKRIICDYCKEPVDRWKDMGDVNFCLICVEEYYAVMKFCVECGNTYDLSQMENQVCINCRNSSTDGNSDEGNNSEDYEEEDYYDTNQ